MALRRLDNIGLVVDDLDAAQAFFAELGMEVESVARVEGPWVDQVVGLDGTRSDIVVMRTPDGTSRLELTRFLAPEAVRAADAPMPANTLGTFRVMFAVDDIRDTVARLHGHGAELIGQITQYQDAYLLCYLRGPAGAIVALAEQLD